MAIEKKKYPRRKPGAPTIYEARRVTKQRAFLDALASGLSINDACGVAGISTASQKRWRMIDPKFASAFRMSYAAGTAMIEKEAIRRAVEGVPRPLWHQGRPVIDPATGQQMVVREYSDTLLIFLLKARAPELYDDRARFETLARKWRKRDGEADPAGAAAAPAVVDLLSRLAEAKAAATTG